jgi:hypothetical protein
VSVTDPASDAAQPDEGQDGEGTSGAPYQEYLDRIPEELREDVEPVFRDWDGQVTKRFQDAAEFRKQWEPLQDTGIHKYDPGDVAWMVQFREALNDPQSIQQWFDSYAKENGLTSAQAQQQLEQAVDDYEYQDPSQQNFERLLEDKLNPLLQKLEQYDGRFAEQEQQKALADAERIINGQITELEQKHGEFNEETKELINTLAGRYIDSDPMNAIPRAYDDLQRWQNNVEKSALQAKVDAPAPAEGGGIPSVTPDQHKRIDSPGVKEAAIEFLRNGNRL